jgi:hypothetical protein
MRVLFVIRMMVVPTMDGYPQGWRELQGESAEHRKRVFEPKRACEAAVRYEPMEPKIDSENAEHQRSNSQKDDARPAKEPRKKCQDREHMTQNETGEGVRLEFHPMLSA